MQTILTLAVMVLNLLTLCVLLYVVSQIESIKDGLGIIGHPDYDAGAPFTGPVVRDERAAQRPHNDRRRSVGAN